MFISWQFGDLQPAAEGGCRLRRCEGEMLGVDLALSLPLFLKEKKTGTENKIETISPPLPLARTGKSSPRSSDPRPSAR